MDYREKIRYNWLLFKTVTTGIQIRRVRVNIMIFPRNGPIIRHCQVVSRTTSPSLQFFNQRCRILIIPKLTLSQPSQLQSAYCSTIVKLNNHTVMIS